MTQNESDFLAHYELKAQTRVVDELIARLAERQEGVVARWQLLEMGIGDGAIRLRLKNGRLHRIYRGVYAVGHPLLTAHGRWTAAVLAGGKGAVLSHRSAGALWQVRRWSGSHEVTIPSSRRHRSNIRWHTANLPPDEVTTHERIPVTGIARTLFDLASVLRPRDLERAMEQAAVHRIADRVSLPVLVERYPRARGRAAIRDILATATIGSTVTRNDLEEALIALVDRHGLPRPHTNRWMQLGDLWFECDAVWLEQRLIVELDGGGAHGTRWAFERDRARDRAAAVAGWRVIRITWRQLTQEPDAIAADLAALLGLAPARL